MTTSFVSEEPLTLADGPTRDYLLHHRVCPMRLVDGGLLLVAATEDAILSGADDIAFVYQRPIVLEVVSRDELERLIERLTTRAERTVLWSRRVRGARLDRADHDWTAAALIECAVV